LYETNILGCSHTAGAELHDEHLFKDYWDFKKIPAKEYMNKTSNIEGDYPVEPLLKELLKGNIVGVANGRAEFGPRAFGNRSLLADPRGVDVKDRVNDIKHRQKFRPFSPSILEEHDSEYFDMVVPKTPYMQYVVKCKYPDKFPATVHVDGTSRVETVSYEEKPGYWKVCH